MSNEIKSKKNLDLTSNNLRKLSSVSLKKSFIPLKKISSDDSARRRAERSIGNNKNVNYTSKSQDCLLNSSNMTYIPFDALLSIVLAEKDAYIKELLKRLMKCDSELNHNFSGLEGYNFHDVKAIIQKDAEVVALKNKIASLQVELEEQKNNISNDKVDLIIDENDSLKIKLKNIEEILQDLLQNNKNLEDLRNNELDYYNFKEKIIEKNELFQLKNEEIARLKNQTEDKPKKVDNKDFMQQTEELNILPVRESEVDNNNFLDFFEELESLRDESIRMKETIDDLQWYEKQYDILKDKLYECDLNAKSLMNENQKLADKIKELESQFKSRQSKEDMSCETESSGKELVLDERFWQVKTDDENEIQRLRMKIKFLSSKLQKSSSELEEEKNRVQSFQKEVNSDWTPNFSSASAQTDDESIFDEKNFDILKNNFDPVFEIQDRISTFINAYERKESISHREVQNFLESSKKIIAFVLENMIEYQKEMEELKIYNQIMKDELEELKSDLNQIEVDELLQRIDKLNILVEEKNGEIENLSKAKKNEINFYRKEVDDLRDFCKILKSLVGDVEEENFILYQELEWRNGLEKVNRDLLADKGNLKKKLEDLKDKYEIEVSELNDRNGVLKNQVAKLISEVENMDRVILNQNETIRKQKEDVEAAKVELKRNDPEEFIEIPKSDYEKFLSEKNAMESVLEHIGKEFTELKKELEGMKKLKSETVQLKQERDCLREKIARSEIEIQDLKAKFSECSALKDQLAKLTPIETALGKKITELNSRKESVKTREILKLNEELINEIEALKSENEKLKNILKDLKKNLEERKKFKEMRSPPSSSASFYSTKCFSPDATSNKIKTLIHQHDKELKARDKIFNEALNSMKSNYENDIRKLMEKHKGSISKLQNLHEDEIQELNTNYETQMEQIQTQHEKILNDFKLSSGEKIKQLTEQRNQDVRDLELKFRQVLNEKETQHMFEISKMQLKMSECDILDDFSEKKKFKKTNMKRLEMMTSKYEDLLKRENKKYEEKLKSAWENLENNSLNCSELKFSGLNDFSSDLGIYFNGETCSVGKFDDSIGGNVASNQNCAKYLSSQVKPGKEEFLNKTIRLESKMEINHSEMQKAVENVEKISTRRLKEMESLLIEQERKNLELQNLLASSYTEKKKYDDEVVEKNREIEKEKLEKKHLEDELLKQKHFIKSLKEKFKNQRKKDLDYIESMRLRLEQELDSERR